MTCFGIRGSILVPHNEANAIVRSALALLEGMVRSNRVEVGAIVSMIFSMTSDLDAVSPAQAVRELGWMRIPCLCVRELALRYGVPRCLRVLMHVNGSRKPEDVRHAFLRETRPLRADAVEERGEWRR